MPGETARSCRAKGATMPKETIRYGETVKRYTEEPDKGTAGIRYINMPTLQVQWEREGEWVQVQLYASSSYWAELAADDSIVATSDKLSRTDLNHMIKTLRRARDAAYGADE